MSEKPRYIKFGRGFGHTTAMMEGAKNYNGKLIIVAHTKAFADDLAKQCKDAVGIGLNETYRLLGRQMPILIDHFAIEVLLGERDRHISRLEGRAERMERAIKDVLQTKIRSKFVKDTLNTAFKEASGE